MGPLASFLLAGFFFTCTAGLSAQSLDWLESEEEALGVSQATGKPILLVITQGDNLKQTEFLLSSWPRFTETLARTVVPLKLKVPAWVPVRPGDLALGLWFPGGPEMVRWKEVPPVLEISRALGVSPPYSLAVRSFQSGQSLWIRQGEGPFWTRTNGQDPTPVTYVEEGPAGPLVILKELAGPLRVALPLSDGWSYQSDSRNQSWSPLEEGKTSP